VVSFYKGNYAAALKELFPEVTFESTKLPIVPSNPLLYSKYLFYSIINIIATENYWSDPLNRKQFFERIAREQQIDPLSLKDWYQLGRDGIFKYKVFLFSVFFTIYY
jgi:hypothetical protein